MTRPVLGGKAGGKGRGPERIDPERWVDAYGDYLFRFAVARVRNATLAEDLVQEVFLAAIRARSSFGGKSSERTWLTGILKNKIVDHFRKSGRVDLINDLAAMKRDQDGHFDEDGHWLIDQPTTPRAWSDEQSARLDREEFWKQFRACADRLPEQTRKVFVMREVDGVESDKICSALRISPQNFWTIMHRARAALRRCLETTFFAAA